MFFLLYFVNRHCFFGERLRGGVNKMQLFRRKNQLFAQKIVSILVIFLDKD